MNEREVLAQRRELVLLSAQMQRATIAARLDRIEARPGLALAGSALRVLGSRWARRAAIIALGIAVRGFRSRRAARAADKRMLGGISKR